MILRNTIEYDLLETFDGKEGWDSPPDAADPPEPMDDSLLCLPLIDRNPKSTLHVESFLSLGSKIYGQINKSFKFRMQN